MKRKAFSLVELLTVVSIVSTLVGLLIPAVQMARESARMTCCKNNLKQLGLAIQLHEQSLGHLPGAGWGSAWTGDPDKGSGSKQPGGWIFSTLPYMECKEIHSMASDGDPGVITSMQKAAAAQASGVPIELVTCPSRRSSPTSPMSPEAVWNMDPAENISKTDYSINSGDKVVRWGNGPNPTSPVFEDMKASTGVAHQASQLKFDHILDGLSNVYLAGEKRLCRLDETQDDQGALFGADLDTTRWTEEPPAIDGDEPGINFGSAHQTLAMVMCDGSVVSIAYEIDPETHSRLGNRKDGKIAFIE